MVFTGCRGCIDAMKTRFEYFQLQLYKCLYKHSYCYCCRCCSFELFAATARIVMAAAAVAVAK